MSACLPADEGPPTPPDPDLRLRRRVAAQVAELGAAYAAATSAHPTLAAALQPLAAEHRAHVAALAGPPQTRSPNGSPSASASSSPQVPETPDATLDWLTGLERQAARRRRTQSLRAGPALARLLASVGACEATHAALLERTTP